MELLFAIIQLLIFVILFIIGEVYLETDRHKVRAAECAQKMKEYLDTWVNLTVALAEGQSQNPKAKMLRDLAKKYSGFKKSKESLRKIALVNSMAALSMSLSNTTPGAETGRILSARSDAANELVTLRPIYNESVVELNDRLKKGIPGAVGRLFRQHSFEELCDLSDL